VAQKFSSLYQRALAWVLLLSWEMKESTLKVLLPAGTLALVGAGIYWFSSPQAFRETAPPPSLASLKLPKAPAGAAAALVKRNGKAEEPAGHGSVHKESSFAAANVRNPFWPIGWTKPQATDSESVAAAPALTPAAFSLTSVAIGAGRRFAILNRKILHEGQQFSVQLGRQLYQITLKAVQDGRVVLAYEGGELVVPLQRR
jgi:hypothetical protein